MKPQRTLEVCCGDILSVANAQAGGASRIELCSALELGGVTPSFGMIGEAQKIFSGKIHVLIRPRGGNFFYTASEGKVMVSDIVEAGKLGIDGVVIGALLPGGYEIDVPLCRDMIDAARHYGMKVTFHRAFDRTASPFSMFQQIIDLRVDYLLTSGCAPTAFEGIETLKELNRINDSRIKIIAASGVNPENAKTILDVTGINEIHASARNKKTSHTPSQSGSSVKMGTMDSDETFITSAETVSRIIRNINRT